MGHYLQLFFLDIIMVYYIIFINRGPSYDSRARHEGSLRLQGKVVTADE